MGDMMSFPESWEMFLHDYEFDDARRQYTNGARLIPSFRVKQMVEHYFHERLNPQPLTVDEMNELNEEPVYIMHVDTIKNGALWHMNGWHILTASTFQNHGQCKWFVDNGWSELDGNYGKTWLAYRTKPEGSAE